MLDDIKKTLWATADKLRANLDAAEYKHLVLGLKRILRKYQYPPDLQDAAVELVLQQAQALGESWAGA